MAAIYIAITWTVFMVVGFMLVHFEAHTFIAYSVGVIVSVFASLLEVIMRE